MSRTSLKKILPDPFLGHETRLTEMLSALGDDQLERLMAASELREVPEGEVLVADGARSEAIGYLLKGALGMQKTLSDGRMHITGLLVPTDMFGRLFDGESHHDIVALTECTVLVFSRPVFEEVLSAAPEVERMFIVSVLDELDSAREWIMLMGGHKVVERMASFLLILLRRNKRLETGEVRAAAEERVTIPISRTNLAHYLGTRPESLSRALHEMEDEGLVRLCDPYTIDILDLPGLVALSGSDLVVDEDL